MKIRLPQKVQRIIHRIEEAGFEAYAVGGCVRDTFLGREPDDWDITTSAAPEQVKALFDKTIDTGIQHGTVTVMLGGEGFEVTTYRLDGEYEDARHPKEVIFTASLEEDLKRRDFTMNAMAYNDRKGLVDLFGGIADLERGLIRCVGDPEERFAEDALRMMRAIRFSAQLGYEIEGGTRQAICELRANLRRISAERIQAELTKLITSPHPEYLRIAYETGVLEVILPELDLAMKTGQNHPHHCAGVGEHTLMTMEKVFPEKELRLAAMLHDIGKPQCLTVGADGITHFSGHARVGAELAEEILRRLKYDNHTIEVVRRLVLYHDFGNGIEPNEKSVRKLMNRMGPELMPALLELKKADILAQNPSLQAGKLRQLDGWTHCYERILERNDCVTLRSLALTGKDLIDLGMKPGREMGETLNKLLELVLEKPEANTRETLQKWVLENKGNFGTEGNSGK